MMPEQKERNKIYNKAKNKRLLFFILRQGATTPANSNKCFKEEEKESQLHFHTDNEVLQKIFLAPPCESKQRYSSIFGHDI